MHGGMSAYKHTVLSATGLQQTLWPSGQLFAPSAMDHDQQCPRFGLAGIADCVRLIGRVARGVAHLQGRLAAAASISIAPCSTVRCSRVPAVGVRYQCTAARQRQLVPLELAGEVDRPHAQLVAAVVAGECRDVVRAVYPDRLGCLRLGSSSSVMPSAFVSRHATAIVGLALSRSISRASISIRRPRATGRRASACVHCAVAGSARRHAAALRPAVAVRRWRRAPRTGGTCHLDSVRLELFDISNSSSEYRINAVNRTTDYNSSRPLRRRHEWRVAECETLSGALRCVMPFAQVRGTLDQIRADGFTRPSARSRVRRRRRLAGGAGVLNFCANNYLGLANDSRLIDAAKAGLDGRLRHGIGTLHLRHANRAQATGKRAGRVSRHRGQHPLFELLRRERRAVRDAARRERRGDQRRAEPREHHRRCPPLQGEALPLQEQRLPTSRRSSRKPTRRARAAS